MNKEASGKICEELLERSISSQYVPNSIENYESFKKRKEAILLENNHSINVLNGIFLFTLYDIDQPRTVALLEKYLSDTLPVDCNDADAFIKLYAEQNIFGLTEEDFDRLLNIADFAYKNGLYREAIDMYQALIVLFPTHLESWLRWGYAESENFFDYHTVLEIYDKCLQIFDHPSVYASIGFCHVKANQFSEAESSFNKCINLCDKYEENELKGTISDLLNKMKSLQ